MPVEWSQESKHAQIMRLWDKKKRDGGMNADGFEKFPMMVYKAVRPASGGPILCVDPGNERFTAKNQLVVNDEAELERAERQGWRQGPKEAIAFAEGLENDISNAAAERKQAELRMSAKAQREAEAVDASTADHVPEIPRKPVSAAVAEKRRASLATARAVKAARKSAPAA